DFALSRFRAGPFAPGAVGKASSRVHPTMLASFTKLPFFRSTYPFVHTFGWLSPLAIARTRLFALPATTTVQDTPCAGRTLVGSRRGVGGVAGAPVASVRRRDGARTTSVRRCAPPVA